MQIIDSVPEMQSLAASLRSNDRLIGLVPTMGALHGGHIELMQAAKDQADIVVVTIFVNPTQFGPSEDFDAYPRGLEQDIRMCEEAGADIVFVPGVEELYPDGYSTFISEEKLSEGLCGISRPNHFRGVLTVVTKLFNIVHPDLAVFGQKDAQQAAVLKKMVADLHFGVRILICPTVREEDGLAMSSRNRSLHSTQRKDAAVIYQALQSAKTLYDSGNRNVDRILAEVTHTLSTSRRIRVIYVNFVDSETLEPLNELVEGRSLLAVAVWVDEVRLIDNIIL
ncbi:MAG: pantoate--beta-alanine ligase [Verrucomicrobia bacterium]|nr:MAG: pantoate--beta-alanine ligase [Verrucomicrobiota bacterium]